MMNYKKPYENNFLKKKVDLVVCTNTKPQITIHAKFHS